MKQYPLLTVLDQLHEFYGVDNLDEDTIITYCLSGLKKIGNNNFIIKEATLHPKYDEHKCVYYVEVPCNILEIIAITRPFEIGKTVDATNDFLAVRTFNIENWIERFKYNKSQFYLPGTFVKYQLAGDKIYFSEKYDTLLMLYKEELVDEEGLPLITDNEVEALGLYCMYCIDYKKARITKDANLLQFAQSEYQQWQKACSKARVPDYLSNNDVNEILDTLHSLDAHQYNVSSTKPIK